MSLLALDINSVRTGWAFGGPQDGAPRSGVWKSPGADDLQRSCGSLYDSMVELSKLIHPAIVVIEAPLMMTDRNPRTGLILLSLYGAALAAVHSIGARSVDAHVATWRKHFLGRGNLRGDEAKKLALEKCRMLRWPAENHDQAEACGIWCWGMSISYREWAPRGTPLLCDVRVA